MSAPLRSLAVRLALAPAAATFRVRQRTAVTWDVVREISGPGVLSVEESPLRIGDLHCDPVAANTAAASAADAWTHAGRGEAVVQCFPIAGERPTGGRLVGPVTAAQFAAACLMRRRSDHCSPDDPVRVEQAERHLDFLRRAS